MNSSLRAKRPRIANIIEEGKLGGPQIRIANVAKALMPDIDTTVVLPFANSDRFRDLLDQYFIPYRTFHMSRITKDPKVAVRYLFFSWYEIVQLARYFRKENFDLVHVSGGSWQYKGIVAGKLAGIKVVWHLNDTYVPWMICQLFRFISPLADAFFFASNRSRDFYKPFLKGHKPEFIIPAPVDSRVFDPEISLANIADGYRQKDRMIIGTVANVNPVKDLETFIKAASILNRRFDNLFFVVIGSIFERQRPYHAKLQLLCKELSVTNLDFLGPKKDVRPFLKTFDVYLCSSRAESSPLSVWEAMSMAKPIVSTDVGDVSLYVQNHENGFIVSVGDAVAMADRVGYLIRNREKRVEFGQKSRAIAVEKLDMSSCIKLYLKAYTQILSNGGGHQSKSP